MAQLKPPGFPEFLKVRSIRAEGSVPWIGTT